MATVRLWFAPDDKALRPKSGGMRYSHLEVYSAALERTVSLPVDEQYGHPYHQLNLVDAKWLPAEVRDHLTCVTLEEVIAGPLAELLPQGKWTYGPEKWEVLGEPSSAGSAARIHIEAPTITYARACLRCILGRQTGGLKPDVVYYQPPAPQPAVLTNEEAATASGQRAVEG